jgi:hypothetical protein
MVSLTLVAQTLREQRENSYTNVSLGPIFMISNLRRDLEVFEVKLL